MEQRLYAWFLTQRERHATISSNILCEKAKQVYASHYGNENFTASRGWLANFKKRYGIRYLKVSGEKLSSDLATVQPFLSKLSQKIEDLNLRPSQIYNADESALFWKLLPDKTLAHSKEKTAPGRKTSKERVTFLVCANGDGSHKLKLMVIGKAKNPRAIKNFVIPVEYHATKNAWMTSALFVKWFQESFVKQVKTFLASNNLGDRALLLIDNAPSHSNESELVSDDGKIITMFLPPNVTPLIQPMDQNAIRLTKLNYRQSLLLSMFSSEGDISQKLKSVNLKDAFFMLSNAWEKVTSNVIRKCWSKILVGSKENREPESESEYDPEDLIPLARLKDKFTKVNEGQQEELEIANLLKKVIPDDTQITDLEIKEWLEGDEDRLSIPSSDGEGSDQSDIELIHNDPKVKHDDAIIAFNTCLKWAEENDAELNELSTLRRLRQKVFQTKHNMRQTKLTDYFK